MSIIQSLHNMLCVSYRTMAYKPNNLQLAKLVWKCFLKFVVIVVAVVVFLLNCYTRACELHVRDFLLNCLGHHHSLGTGKTITGVHVAYWFAEINRRSTPLERTTSADGTPDKAPPQVLYCGPSNKSVDVVAGVVSITRA